MPHPDPAIESIVERNRRVEADKAWETSMFRRICIALITYATATLFLWSIGIDQPYVHALVPTGGYVLSTLSLPGIKRWWIRKYASAVKR